MARSNNQDRTGAPAGRPTRTAPPAEPQFGGQQYAPQPGYDTQSGQPGQLPWPPQHPPYGQPTQPPQGYPQLNLPPQQGYAADPQYGQYLPQGGPAQGYPATPQYQDQPPQLRGSYADSEAGYDFGGYVTPPPFGAQAQNVGQNLGPNLGQSFGQPPGPPLNQGSVNFGASRGQIAPPPPQGYPPPYGQPNPQGQQQFDQGFAAPQAQSAEENYDDEEYDDEDEEYEAPRRFGIFKVFASLVIAVALGGGGAVAWKMYGAKFMASHPPLLLKADATPLKTLSANAADQQVASAAGNSGDPIPQVVPSADTTASDTPGGARRVQTIAISPPAAPPAAEPPLRPTMSLPGLAIEGLPIGPAPAPTLPPKMTAQPPILPTPAGRAAAQPVAPKMVASLDQPPTVTPKAAPKKVIVANAVPKANDAYAPSPGAGAAMVATATTPPPARTGSNGFVSVLFSSQGNAIDARKALDALQTKYAELLGGKATDVTEVTVKGQQYFRAIVGPPGSREQSSSLCAQLKAAGHKDCFTAAY